MRPFEGIKIIDVTHVLAGPFAAYQLALLGADVIKVEHPREYDQSRDTGGDRALNQQQMGTGYLTQGSNKRAITLNLKHEGGREILKRLVAGADVLVENWRSGSFPALGLGYDDLRPLNPRLIYCSMTAFGQDGPRGGQTAYDQLIQATSGMMATTGTPEVHPIKTGAPVIDYATGTMCAFAISAALFQRERTGRGQYIDSAMLDVALMLMGSHITELSAHGSRAQAQGQPDGPREQPALPGQRHGPDDRREQPRPARAPVHGPRTAGPRGPVEPRGARPSLRAAHEGAGHPHRAAHGRRVGAVSPGAPRPRRPRPHARRGAERSAARGPPGPARASQDRRGRRAGHRAPGRVQVRPRRPEHRDSAAPSRASTPRRCCSSSATPKSKSPRSAKPTRSEFLRDLTPSPSRGGLGWGAVGGTPRNDTGRGAGQPATGRTTCSKVSSTSRSRPAIRSHDQPALRRARAAGAAAARQPAHARHWHLIAPRLAQHFTVVAPTCAATATAASRAARPITATTRSGAWRRTRSRSWQHSASRSSSSPATIAARARRIRMALDHPERGAQVREHSTSCPPTTCSPHARANGRSIRITGSSWRSRTTSREALRGKEDYYILKKLTKLGIGQGRLHGDALKEYARCCTPENIHGVCEDYRAGATIDFEMDKADFEAGRKIDVSVAIYWGEQSHHREVFRSAQGVAALRARHQASFRRCRAGTTRWSRCPDLVYQELDEFFKR